MFTYILFSKINTIELGYLNVTSCHGCIDRGQYLLDVYKVSYYAQFCHQTPEIILELATKIEDRTTR